MSHLPQLADTKQGGNFTNNNPAVTSINSSLLVKSLTVTTHVKAVEVYFLVLLFLCCARWL